MRACRGRGPRIRRPRGGLRVTSTDSGRGGPARMRPSVLPFHLQSLAPPPANTLAARGPSTRLPLQLSPTRVGAAYTA
ncbi:unnamed protein product, partial [Iphiclides podalirius]